MLTMTGLVENAYITRKGTNDQGQAYGGKHKVQLRVKHIMQDGQFKFQFHDLTVKDVNQYQEGREYTFPVDAMVLKGEIFFYAVSEGQVLD